MTSDRRYTDTSQKVAALLGEGHSVLEVARTLHISPQAVYAHIHRYGLPLPTASTTEREETV